MKIIVSLLFSFIFRKLLEILREFNSSHPNVLGNDKLRRLKTVNVNKVL
jgi:hypothetical protein